MNIDHRVRNSIYRQPGPSSQAEAKAVDKVA
jgi:hypothetical protein